MSSFVYFVRPKGMPGPIKIGFSESPIGRLMQLGTWSPFPLELVATIPGTRALEANIHECFADDWSHREWFFPSGRLVEAVGRIAAGAPVEQAIDLNDRRGERPRQKVLRTEEERRYIGYGMRISHACRRAQKTLGVEWRVYEPQSVKDAMNIWRGSYFCGQSHRGPAPSSEQMAEIDRFLADPLTFGSAVRWRSLPPSPLPSPEPAPC